MIVKLISLDLDGTLLTPEGTVTAASKAAIARARAAGLRVVINTGRPAQEAVAFAREAGCDLLASGAGGGLVVNGETGQTVRRWDVPDLAGRRALELVLNWDARLLVYAGNEVLVNAACKTFMESRYPFPVFHNTVIVTEDFLGYMEEHQLPLVKIHGEIGPGGCPTWELNTLSDVTITSSSSHDFELTAGGADKGQALAVIAEEYGIPLEECAAVGDSENDLAALRLVGMPVAMGNAPQRVKDAAARVAPSNEAEGAAWAVLSCLDPDSEGI